MDDWVHAHGKRDGREYMAAVRHPLDRARWPDYDNHVAITIRYAAHWRTGLPKSSKDLTRLQDLEDRMIEHLEGHGALVATETTDARRTIHLYIRGGGPLIERYREHEREPTHKGMTFAVAHDPGWDRVAHLAELSARAA